VLLKFNTLWLGEAAVAGLYLLLAVTQPQVVEVRVDFLRLQVFL
jgi:hypothetical protein